jgi:ABC-type nitrate/sulfonate/bicarbonate transport system permease component
MTSNPRIKQALQAAASTLAIAVVWQILSYFFPHYLFPPVQDILGRTAKIFLDAG